MKSVKILLTGILKNESKNVLEFLDSMSQIAHAVCVVDTGSTDNSLDLVEQWSASHPDIPCKWDSKPFAGFGPSRSESLDLGLKFLDQLGWTTDQYTIFAFTVDFDMRLELKGTFYLNPDQPCYSIQQYNESSEFYNYRLLNLKYKWICKYQVHENWVMIGDEDNVITRSINLDPNLVRFYFKDERRLMSKYLWYLELGLKEYENHPNDPRIVFYLANSYKDIHQWDKAIETYHKRIDLGPPDSDEIWYCYYQLVFCYVQKSDLPQAEHWCRVARKLNPYRAEPIGLLCQTLRGDPRCSHYYHLWMSIDYPDHRLSNTFIETGVYYHIRERERVLNPVANGSLTDTLDYIGRHRVYAIGDHELMDRLHTQLKTTRISFAFSEIKSPDQATQLNVIDPNIPRIRLEDPDGKVFIWTPTCVFDVDHQSDPNLIVHSDGTYTVDSGQVRTYRWWSNNRILKSSPQPRLPLSTQGLFIVSVYPWTRSDSQKFEVPLWWDQLSFRSSLRTDPLSDGYWGLLMGQILPNTDNVYLVCYLDNNGCPTGWTIPFTIPYIGWDFTINRLGTEFTIFALDYAGQMIKCTIGRDQLFSNLNVRT